MMFVKRDWSEQFRAELSTTVVHIDTLTCEQFFNLRVDLALGSIFSVFI